MLYYSVTERLSHTLKITTEENVDMENTPEFVAGEYSNFYSNAGSDARIALDDEKQDQEDSVRFLDYILKVMRTL